jgi:hypothetical protein
MASTFVVRASIIAGMAIFYMTFLFSVMQYFEEPEAMPDLAKTTQSVTVPDRVVVSVPDQFATVPAYKQHQQQQQELPLAYVKSRVYPSPTASSQDVNFLPTALLNMRREIKDHSQMNLYRICDDSGRCKALFPSGTIRPRLREPMGGQMVRNALGWLRSAKSIMVSRRGSRAVDTYGDGKTR